MGFTDDASSILFRFFYWDGYWGSVVRDSTGYSGELLNISEYPEAFDYAGNSLKDVFFEFLYAVDDYVEIEKRLNEDIGDVSLTEEELDEMYQRFLEILRERYPDKWNDEEEM